MRNTTVRLVANDMTEYILSAPARWWRCRDRSGVAKAAQIIPPAASRYRASFRLARPEVVPNVMTCGAVVAL